MKTNGWTTLVSLTSSQRIDDVVQDGPSDLCRPLQARALRQLAGFALCSLVVGEIRRVPCAMSLLSPPFVFAAPRLPKRCFRQRFRTNIQTKNPTKLANVLASTSTWPIRQPTAT